MPAIVLVFDLCWCILRYGSHRNLAFGRMLSPQRLAYLVSGLLLMQSHDGLLRDIHVDQERPALLYGGFLYDRLHADIDAALQWRGRSLAADPGRLVGTDSIRNLVEWNYHLGWRRSATGVVLRGNVAARPKLRTRYLFAFMLVWIIVGNVLAGLFLSAGPAFYGLVTGDSQRFAEQLQFLAQGR